MNKKKSVYDYYSGIPLEKQKEQKKSQSKPIMDSVENNLNSICIYL